MCLRPHRKTKNGAVYEYWSLVRSVRTERGPRQQTVAFIGKEPGHDRDTRMGWEQIGAALDGRVAQADLFEDPHADEPEWATVDVSRVRVERLRDFGDVYLGLALWRRLGLDRFFDEQMVAWAGTDPLGADGLYLGPGTLLFPLLGVEDRRTLVRQNGTG